VNTPKIIETYKALGHAAFSLEKVLRCELPAEGENPRSLILSALAGIQIARANLEELSCQEATGQ
jgi:hypothetical protein